jgi:trk system potassium uptake protein TrkH
MNYRLALHVLGGLLLFLAAMLLTPIPFSIWYGDGQSVAFVLAAGVTALVGTLLLRRFRSAEQMTLREGFAVVTFAWVGFGLFGSLPYLFCGSLVNPVDAIFESMSGFTTCGASVYREVEAVPRSLLFWRALTQWIGGMGVIVLGVAVLPLLGVGGMHLFEAESAGLSPSADRLTPRIQDTARLLWGVYALITASGTALLMLGDMDFFDALCHTFTAVASGGFSTRNNSVAAFGTYSQLVLILVMLLGTINFSLHYYALRGQLGRFWGNTELRWYLGFWAGLIAVVAVANAAYRQYDDWLLNLRDSAFNVTSVVTTAGFATADYKQWPVLATCVMFLSMFIGGCAGSTSGGFKIIRLVIVLRHAGQQLRRLVNPRQVLVLKVDGRSVSPEVVQDVLGFAVLFLGVFLGSTLLLTAVNLDLVTASTASVACLSTVGPGLGAVGPVDNYAGLPAFAKIVLAFVMLLGRLEISTVLVLFLVRFWRK